MIRQMTLDEFLPAGKDPLAKEVARLIVTTGKVSMGSVQRHFNLGYIRTKQILEQLADEGVIGRDYEATNPKGPLMTEEEYLKWAR